MLELTPGNFARRFSPLAGALGEERIGLLLTACRTHEVAAGEALIAEGTTTDALFLVWDGELDVYIDTLGGDREIGRVGPGAYLGEVSLMDPGPATASVVADQGCTALRLGRDELEELIRDHPELATALLKELNRTLADRITRATARLGRLAGSEAQALEAAPVDALVEVHGDLYRRSGP